MYSCPNWLGGALGRGFGIDKTLKDSARIVISSTDILSVGTFEESCLGGPLMIDGVFAALYRPQDLVIFLDPRVLLINQTLNVVFHIILPLWIDIACRV